MIRKSLAILALTMPGLAFGLKDSLQKSIAVAASGNEIQSERIKIAAENLSNEFTTGDKPGGDPYRRKILFVENKYDKKKRTNLVKVKKYDEDKSDFEMKYDPNHPAADENGYVKLPNVRKVIEISDANEAKRAHEANLGVIEISKSLIQKSIDVIR